MQISKFYTYYLKKLFKNVWFWVGVVIVNIGSFWQRFQVDKAINLYNRSEKIFGYEVNMSIWSWKAFWGWTIVFTFLYLFFWLILAMPSTIGNLVGTTTSEPKENGEDAFFLSYTSPIKRSDLIWAKFLAGFTFFMVANFLYSLSAIFWWIKGGKTALDYLFIFFQIFLIPVLFFGLLAIPLYYFASKFSAKAVRAAVNYIIPVLSFLMGGVALYLLGKVLGRTGGTEKGAAKVFWDTVKLFDYSFLIFLVFVLLSLLIGFAFFYLYQKKFQEKDIT